MVQDGGVDSGCIYDNAGVRGSDTVLVILEYKVVAPAADVGSLFSAR